MIRWTKCGWAKERERWAKEGGWKDLRLRF